MHPSAHEVGDRDRMAERCSDAERRLRQCDRLGRVLRILGLIQGKGGPWNARALARELECSERTIYRSLQVLSSAGIPWFFDESRGGYGVRPGFPVPASPSRRPRPTPPDALADHSLDAARRIVADVERLIASLERLKSSLQAAPEEHG